MLPLDQSIANRVIQPRQSNSHKGSYGRVLIVAGDENLGGAAILNAQGAVYAGAGLVTVATNPVNKTALHARLPEAMVVDYQDDLSPYLNSADVVLVGSGLGQQVGILNRVLAATRPTQTVILDGSALTMIAADQAPYPAGQLILTPHQKEWERLSGITIAQQGDQARNRTALQALPADSRLVLKSNHTQVYLADEVYELTVGGPYQATGGMGDTLAGMIAGFTAQFQPLNEAVLAAVYSHSAIASQLAAQAYVTLPSAIAQAIPAFMQAAANQQNTQ
ncbi:NAD(P)H-hydrate dehydratase [Leuconostocaceae bacterium ESL0958]|nr:NAD(P)H-hydrate dehydratase [Leuconostocaceae bacterium ESL0958]